MNENFYKFGFFFCFCFCVYKLQYHNTPLDLCDLKLKRGDGCLLLQENACIFTTTTNVIKKEKNESRLMEDEMYLYDL